MVTLLIDGAHHFGERTGEAQFVERPTADQIMPKPSAWLEIFNPKQALDFSHDLTGIYGKRYIKDMESAFTVLAEPTRRAILTLLATGERSVGDLESALSLSQPSVSKHLRVLRDAGFVEATIDAQRRVYRIRAEPLQEVDAWMAQFRRYWSARVDALERHLDRMVSPGSSKKQSRRQR